MNWINFSIKTIFSLFIFSISFAIALEIDYTGCKSIQDIINLETGLILNHKLDDFESLTNLYISRGETYLLNEQPDDAINDFRTAYKFLDKIKNKKTMKFRLLFNEILWHTILNNKTEVEILGEQLICMFDEICFQKPTENQTANLFTKGIPIFFCNTTKIIGPDQEPYPG